MSSTPIQPTACTACATPLTPGQRYCLACGERNGTPTVDIATALGAVAAGSAVDGAAAADTPPGATAAEPDTGLRGRLSRLPRAVGPIAAAVTLLLGVTVGAMVSAGAGSSDAATSRGAIFLGGRGATVSPAATTPAAAAVDDTAVDDTAVAVDPVAATPVAATPVTAATPATSTGTSTDTGTDLGSTTGDTTDTTETPAIDHVWVITLSNRTDWFSSSSPAPSIRKLAAKGTTLTGFAPVSTGSVPAGVALLGGQAPTDETRVDCPTFSDVSPATVTDGLITGQGCVVPKAAGTLTTQLKKAKKTWRAYVQGAGSGCRHPDVGAVDPWRDASAADGFLTARNPFVYFHAVIDDTTTCTTNVADFSRLDTDLAASDTVPDFGWVIPDTFHDGREQPGGAGGPAAADTFVKDTVAKIQATDSYAQGGLIAIVPDGPATLPDGATAPPATGALLLSPQVKKGGETSTATGPYALLKTIQDRLGLSPYLGHAGDAEVAALGDDVFTSQTSSDLR